MQPKINKLIKKKKSLVPSSCQWSILTTSAWCHQIQTDFCSNKLLKFLICLNLSFNSSNDWVFVLPEVGTWNLIALINRIQICFPYDSSKEAKRFKAIIPTSKHNIGTSLVAHWLRIRLPMQGTRVRSLVWEDPTCRRATKPVRHNYWPRVPQLLKPARLEPVLCNQKPPQWEAPEMQWRVAPTRCN